MACESRVKSAFQSSPSIRNGSVVRFVVAIGAPPVPSCVKMDKSYDWIRGRRAALDVCGSGAGLVLLGVWGSHWSGPSYQGSPPRIGDSGFGCQLLDRYGHDQDSDGLSAFEWSISFLDIRHLPNRYACDLFIELLKDPWFFQALFDAEFQARLCNHWPWLEK